MKVFYNALCLEKTNEPLRIHHKKRWMYGRRYHERVQKKWLKRWGCQMRPAIYRASDSIFAHPSFKQHFESAFKEHADRTHGLMPNAWWL